jgi:hypothetical protein
MSSKIPKTGLASRMRAWMCGRTYKFTAAHLYEALIAGHDRPGTACKPVPQSRVCKALQDFVRRAEVVPLGPDRRCNPPVDYYAYNPAWHRMNKGVLNQRIYKAMRLISFRESFTVANIQRATQSADRNYIDKIIGKLVKTGYLRLEYVRKLPQGGREKFYRVINTDRFLLEVMR